MPMSMALCKKRLGLLWFSGSAFLFLLVLFQTVLGHYNPTPDEAWGWLMPGLLPTLSLIISVLVMDALDKSVKVETVDRFLFLLTFGLSTFYLLMLALSIFLQPFSTLDPVAMLKQSSLWLGPLQGLVSAALAAFFIKRDTP